jgi:hypothetical protein
MEKTLAGLAEFLSHCRDPWCVFGGAALYVHGYRDAPVADIDVLVSPDDCERIVARHSVCNEADGGTQRFRSRAVLRPRLGPVAVEIMSDFEIFADGRWHSVEIETVAHMRLGSIDIPVAGIEDICSILKLSGREKDLQRLRLIDLSR